MKAELICKNEQPFFQINGTDYPPVAFMSYNPSAERCASFRKEGMKLFSCTLFMGERGIHPAIGLGAFTDNFWKGYGQYDFTACDTLFEMLLPGGKGGFIFPRLFCDAPRWWHEAHPEECCVNSAGVSFLQSYSSDVWRQDIKEAIHALMDHIAASPWAECVFGYHLAYGGTEECTYQNPGYDLGALVDRSSVNLSHYRAWLKKNGVKDAENATFPMPYEIYGTRGAVIRDPEKEAHVIHYLRYHCHVLADTLIFLCKCVKEHGGDLITGGFWGYIIHYGNVLRGHNAVGEVLDSPYVDFISSAGGGFTMASTPASAKLHGKLWFTEGDIRTHKTTLMGNTMPNVLPPHNSRYIDRQLWKGPETELLGVSNLRKGAANVITRKCGIWYFDMFGGWFDDPALRSEIQAAPRWMTEQSKPSSIDLKRRVALIVDEKGHLEYEPMTDEIDLLMNTFPNELRRSGLGYDVYLAEDLAHPDFPADDYDMYFLSGLVRPTEEIRRGVERLKANSRTLVWLHAGGINDPTLSDFEVIPERSIAPIQADFLRLTKGTVLGTYPARPMRCGRFTEADIAQSYTLARIHEGAPNAPAMLLKSMNGYTSVFCLLPSMPAEMIHELATQCGVFTHAFPGDYLFVGGRYIGLCSAGGGEKRLFLPIKIKRITDAVTGKEWPVNENSNIPFHLEPGETKLFKIEE